MRKGLTPLPQFARLELGPAAGRCSRSSARARAPPGLALLLGPPPPGEARQDLGERREAEPRGRAGVINSCEHLEEKRFSAFKVSVVL